MASTWQYTKQDEPINEEALEHEGWALGVLADGTVPTELVGGRRFALAFDNEFWYGEKVPQELATWQRPVCTCGWSGEDVPVNGTQVPDDYYPGRTIHTGDLAARRQWQNHVKAEVTRHEASEWTQVAHEMVAKIRSLPDPLERLRRLSHIEANISASKDATVNLAREQGLSWAAIGEAMGMSRSAAHSKFRPDRQVF